MVELRAMAHKVSDDSFWNFLKSFGRDWAALMTGPLSLLLAVIAQLASGWSRMGLLTLAAACLIFASFRIWKTQQIEIARLKVRPYEDSQRQLVSEMLAPFGPDEREVLRYFVQHGEREQQQISIDLKLDQPRFAAAFNSVAKSALLDREERQKVGRAGLDLFWRVNPQFVEVLKDELFSHSENPSAASSSLPAERLPSKAALNLKRSLVALGAVAAVYFALGSWFFPEWYFGILWGGKFLDRAWWMQGVSYWLDLHTGWLTIGIILAFVVSLLAHKYRRRFLPFIDRLAGRLILSFVVAFLVGALLDYKYAKTSFQRLIQVEVAMDNLKSAIQRLVPFENTEQSALQEPIYFQYLDRNGVDALYSQLEPELIERQRTVSSDVSTGEKASIAVGTAEGELSAKQQKKATSSFERSGFSPERKCLELMKFSLAQKPSHFYTSGGEWFAKKLLQTFREDANRALKQTESSEAHEVTAPDLEKLRLDSPAVPPSKEQQEQSERRIKQYNDEFVSELSSLSGLVLVDGAFALHSEPNRETSVLIEQFSEKPRAITFHVLVPNNKQLRRLVATGNTKLRVFGTVTKRLDDGGVIELRGIAIY